MKLFFILKVEDKYIYKYLTMFVNFIIFYIYFFYLGGYLLIQGINNLIFIIKQCK